MNMLAKLKEGKRGSSSSEPGTTDSGSETTRNKATAAPAPTLRRTRAASPVKAATAQPVPKPPTRTTSKHNRDEGETDEDELPPSTKRSKAKASAIPIDEDEPFPLPDPPKHLSEAAELFGEEDAEIDIESSPAPTPATPVKRPLETAAPATPSKNPTPTPIPPLQRLLSLLKTPHAPLEGSLDRVLLRNAVLQCAPEAAGYLSAAAVFARSQHHPQNTDPFFAFKKFEDWKLTMFSLLHLFGISQEMIEAHAAEHKTAVIEEWEVADFFFSDGIPRPTYKLAGNPLKISDALRKPTFTPVPRRSAWKRAEILHAMLESKDEGVRRALLPIAIVADTAIRIKFACQAPVTEFPHHFLSDLLELPALPDPAEHRRQRLAAINMEWVGPSDPVSIQEPKIV